MNNNFNFEESLNKLENIVEQLENGSCSLDKALELYADGIKLYKNCNNYLNNAKLKIEALNTTEEPVND